MRLIVSCVIWITFLCATVQAAERRVALVIGNSAYQSAPKLQNPVNDARGMAKALTDVGFEVVEGYDLDHQKMTETLRDFSRVLDGATTALFFYAGHGLQVDGRNYMVPIDARLANKSALDVEAVDAASVLTLMEREPRVNIVLLDACRDNPLSRTLARSLGATRSTAVGRGLARIETVSVGTLISFSTAAGEVAADGKGTNSPFTAALLQNIRTPGLEIQQMLRRVRATVVKGSEGKQVPWDNSSLMTDFYFVPPQEGSDPNKVAVAALPELSDRQIELRLWTDVKDSRSAQELQGYLDKFPDGVFADPARARIKALGMQAESGSEGTVAEMFARLARRDAILPEPREPHEFYQNARLYEIKGDALNARRSYAKLFASEVPYVDPHHRYQKFLRVQEGRAGAREIYNEMVYDRPKDMVLAYAAALLGEREDRIRALEAVIADKPDFAPALYDLSLDFSQKRLGSQTFADKKRERELLTAFLDLAGNGAFLKHFLDQGAAAEQIEDARQRLAALSGIGENVLKNPVSLSTSRHNAGWTLTFTLPDRPEELFIALPGKDFVSTGYLAGVRDPLSGKPMASQSYELPRNAGAMTLRVRYRDSRGAVQGPFDVNFNPDSALFAGQKDIIERFSTSWIAFRSYNGKMLTYFTHLLSYRCALAEIRYGVDSETADKTFPLGRCNAADPYAIEHGAEIYTEIPKSARFVTVELVFTDGSRSPAKRFDVDGGAQ